MIADDKNPQSNTDYTLREWFQIAGVRTDVEVADEASRLNLVVESKVWDPKRVNEMKNGIKTLNRVQALQCIAILRSIAARNEVNLFTPPRFEHDAAVFLNSKACTEKYALPTNQELYSIFQTRIYPERSSEDLSLSQLRSRVQPTPPLELFGREKDLQSALKALGGYPVSIIDGIAGDGKTSLAWGAALKAWESRQFTHFDWTTDKRHVVDIYGNLMPLGGLMEETDFFETILISLCRQFAWLDLLGLRDQQLIDACADRLRSGRYLLVVDNLESVENSDGVIRQLLDMLSPIYSSEPLSSRALITSRQRVSHPNIGTIAIAGINEIACMSFIRYLENTWQAKILLSESQCQQLAKSAGGNPLFVQIAMRRYTLSPGSFDEILADIADGKHHAFNTLFAPLIQQLSLEAKQFACVLAYELSFASQDLITDDLKLLWQAQDDIVNRTFEYVMSELVNNRIISWNEQGSCTMHPLIRSYFVNMNC